MTSPAPIVARQTRDFFIKYGVAVPCCDVCRRPFRSRFFSLRLTSWPVWCCSKRCLAVAALRDASAN